MSQLKDLKVDWVSVVDKASTRDPQRKREPRRFLLWKSQDAHSRMALQEALDKAELAKREAVAARERAEKSQKEAEAKLAKGRTNNTHTQKENRMSTVTESNLNLADRQTIARALSLLETVEGRDREVDDAIGELRGAGEDEDELEKIEKSLTDMSALRVELAKSASPNPLQRERVEKAHRDLELAYLQRVSGAHQGWRGEQLARMRKVEGGGAA